jgi:DNA-binding HxlR family transcriptional regulator
MYSVKSNLGTAVNVATTNERDKQIMWFIAVRGEVFFKELEESNMMAKSTLSKHLRSLRDQKLVARVISKRRQLGPHDVVYVVTSKGKKILTPREMRMTSLEDWYSKL